MRIESHGVVDIEATAREGAAALMAGLLRDTLYTQRCRGASRRDMDVEFEKLKLAGRSSAESRQDCDALKSRAKGTSLQQQRHHCSDNTANDRENDEDQHESFFEPEKSSQSTFFSAL